MTKHCNNCNSQKESWADYPNYHSSEAFARDELERNYEIAVTPKESCQIM